MYKIKPTQLEEENDDGKTTIQGVSNHSEPFVFINILHFAGFIRKSVSIHIYRLLLLLMLLLLLFVSASSFIQFSLNLLCLFCHCLCSIFDKLVRHTICLYEILDDGSNNSNVKYGLLFSFIHCRCCCARFGTELN